MTKKLNPRNDAVGEGAMTQKVNPRNDEVGKGVMTKRRNFAFAMHGFKK